ncbi:type III pantothenate kinase [Empedobacter falsenii]|uniref:Type III pantothenate kinase n=1 Tax=Empedobacter falsenii TaxID=343874 RepID=A0ABY8V493_9FLAO|nr:MULTISPECIES: type III pantothenate kinase [Empedobacter]MCA4775889.1 type III pantothenate kinase [Empedobacter stercoris]WIH96182.1 type III pantothenate kinase [Empedobacter falsenii]
MLLAVNIGNTNLRFAVFKSEKEIITWTINSKPYRTEYEFFAKFSNMYEPFGISKDDITDIVIGSVVPPLTTNVKIALQRIHKFKPMVVDRHTPSEIVHTSNQMGTDLYANAVAAHYQDYKGKKIVIDFGTALTFLGINEDGKVRGVVIAPGIITALNSLVGETAQLPTIELRAPEKVLGSDTETCMQSGMVYGFLSMVEGMVDRINAEAGEKSVVISTGGVGGVYKPLTNKIDIDDRLHTIKGLKILYELNKDSFEK